jgi:parallel beta-helix repeat protein
MISLNNFIEYTNRNKILPTSYFLLLTFFTSYFLLSSCSQATENGEEGVTFSGIVTLEGETDHSGVTISLYKPVELDTALVRINEQYPNIGVKISQQTEFDHRDHEPAYVTLSQSDGSWIIDGISPGDYNVVAEKDSFGWAYQFESNDNSNTNLPELTLYKSIYITGNIFEDIILMENQSLIITNNTVLTDQYKIQFSKNNKLLFARGTKLEVYGLLQFDELSENYHLISSIDPNAKGSGLFIKNEGQVLSNIVFSYLNNAVFTDALSANLEIKNCLLHDCDIGLYLNSSNSKLSNVTINYINDTGIECLKELVLINTLICKSDRGIISIDNYASISNNYFYENNLALIAHKGDIFITNNNFESNNIGVVVSASDCTIQKNEFYNNQLDIELNRVSIQSQVLFDYSEPDISYNNYLGTNTVISVFGENGLSGVGSVGVGISEDLLMANCYWNITVDFYIQERIIDVNDEPNYRHSVLYNPILESQYHDAGILK